MKPVVKLAAAAAACFLFPYAAPASAQSVTGSALANADPNNIFDPANGYVPAAYGNSAGTTVAIGPGVEFGAQYSNSLITVDLTGTGFTITDAATDPTVANFLVTLNSSTPGLFSDVTLVSSDFNPSSTNYGTGPNGEFFFAASPNGATSSASFSFAAVPEPTTWAMMLLGFGGIGFAMRRRNSAKLQLA